MIHSRVFVEALDKRIPLISDKDNPGAFIGADQLK